MFKEDFSLLKEKLTVTKALIARLPVDSLAMAFRMTVMASFPIHER